jgi:hypothetical protein
VQLDLETHKNDEHSVLAFYGIEPTPGSAEKVLEQALKWMARFGCPPQLMGTNLTKGYLRFKNAERKAKAAGPSSLKTFEVVSLSKGARNTSEGTTCAICYFREKSESALRHLIIDFESAAVRLRSPNFLLMAKEAGMLTNPSYGMSYERLFGWGPVHYAMGLANVNETEEERLRTSHWLEALDHKLYESGLIRDVYPWNFLTMPHLETMVGQATLEEWIRVDAKRGVLSPLTDRVQLWVVQEEEIPAVRNALVEANIIFDYDSHIVAAMEMFNVRGGEIKPGEEAKEFFQAWVTKGAEEMKQWFRKKYGREKFDSKPRSEQEVLQNILQGMGYDSPQEVQVLKVEKPGQVRELSDQEVKKVLEQPTKNPHKSK